jgi:hypothetical protein
MDQKRRFSFCRKNGINENFADLFFQKNLIQNENYNLRCGPCKMLKQTIANSEVPAKLRTYLQWMKVDGVFGSGELKVYIIEYHYDGTEPQWRLIESKNLSPDDRAIISRSS